MRTRNGDQSSTLDADRVITQNDKKRSLVHARRTSLMRWVRRRSFLVVVPLLYIAIAWGHWIARKPEFYPFAPWAMFNDVPNSVTRYVLLVQPDEPADSKAVPVWSCYSDGVKSLPLVVYRAQAELGRAVERQDLEPARRSRRILLQFVREHFGTGQATLVKEVFDPAEKFLNQTNTERRELHVIEF